MLHAHMKKQTRGSFLDLEDAVKEENTIVSIRTVDTDVVVLAVTSAQRLTTLKYGLLLELENAFVL